MSSGQLDSLEVQGVSTQLVFQPFSIATTRSLKPWF